MRDRGLLPALGRLIGLTLAAVGAAFVLTMLLAGQGDANAATGAGQPSATSIPDGEADAAATAPRPVLWADADALERGVVATGGCRVFRGRVVVALAAVSR